LPSQTLPPTVTPYPHVSDQLLPYPNPVSPDDVRACFAFPAAPGASVQLFDLLGQPVATLDAAQIQAPQGFACWDLRATDGTRAAPGLYFVRVVANGQAHLAKFTLR